jgi:hypothetical protein
VSCWNERGFNQRGTTFFLEDHYMDKKNGEKKTKVGKKCFSLPLKVENSYQDFIFIQSHYFQINFGIQGCHQFLLFTTNHYLTKQNSQSINMGGGTQSH